MPPERAEQLTILDLKLDDEILVGECVRFRPKSGVIAGSAQLEIFWHAEPLREDMDRYWSVGHGVAYVLRNADYDEPLHLRQKVETWGPGRYAWTDFSDVIVALLPDHSTAVGIAPEPQSKEFGDRIALLWHLQRDSAGRVRVEWELERLVTTLEVESQRINREYRKAHPQTPPGWMFSNSEVTVLMGDKIGRDKIVVSGTAGIVGGQNEVTGDVTAVGLSGLRTPADWTNLATELGALRNELRRRARSTEEDLAVGSVAAAEMAAQKHDQVAVVAHLASAGKWALQAAKDIGVNVASELIKSAMVAHGIPVA